ncbi:hypothetical protein ABK040_008449 [Willaertia magna]
MSQQIKFTFCFLLCFLLCISFVDCFTDVLTCPANVNSFFQCEDATCGVYKYINYQIGYTNVSNTISVGCPCVKEKDLSYSFTVCDPITNTKSLFYYLNPPAVCTGLEVPPPVSGIPCEMDCTDGKYLDVNTQTCQPCQAGSYTTKTSGTIIYENFSKYINSSGFTNLPYGMTTFCTATNSQKRCSKWQIEGDIITSGNNFNYQSVVTTLQLEAYFSEEAVFKEKAFVSFEYIYDAEDSYETFSFLVDGVSYFSLKKDKLSWEKVKISIPKAGKKILQWTYTKDFMVSQGSDKAKIRSIEIEGEIADSSNQLSCTKCPKGSYSNGTVPCSPCPVNTYADEEGLSICKVCPDGKKSSTGAITCLIDDTPCLTSDYSYRYASNCELIANEWKRRKEYFWVEPKICNSDRSDSAILPNTEIIPCSGSLQCRKGQTPSITNPVGESCNYCEPGKFSSDGTSCLPCNANQISTTKNFILYDSKSGTTIPQIMNNIPLENTCIGECSTNGWRDLGVNGLDSGVANGASQVSMYFGNLTSIQLDINSKASYIRLKYAMSCQMSYDTKFDVFLNDILTNNLQCSGCKDLSTLQDQDFTILDIPLQGHQQTIATLNLLFTTNERLSKTDSYSCNRVLIKSIEIIGTLNIGGSFECDTCKAGTQPSIDKCTDCDPGTASSDASVKCETCPVNTFSYRASPKCYNCGAGMISTEGSSFCSWQNNVCTMNNVSIGNSVKDFNFGKLNDYLYHYNDGFVGTNVKNRNFFFNICNSGGNNKRELNKREYILENIKEPTDGDVCPPGSFVCLQQQNNQIVDLGNSLSIDLLKDNSNIGLTLTFKNYKNNCYNNVTQNYESTSFKLNTICNIDYSNLNTYPEIKQIDSCNFEGNIYSVYSCPICKGYPIDFDRVEGECNTNTKQRIVHYIRKNDIEHKCAFGQDLTNTVVYESCEVPTQSNVWVVGLVFGILIFIGINIGVIVGIYFYLKRKIVKGKYINVDDNNAGEKENAINYSDENPFRTL